MTVKELFKTNHGNIALIGRSLLGVTIRNTSFTILFSDIQNITLYGEDDMRHMWVRYYNGTDIVDFKLYFESCDETEDAKNIFTQAWAKYIDKS